VNVDTDVYGYGLFSSNSNSTFSFSFLPAPENTFGRRKSSQMDAQQMTTLGVMSTTASHLQAPIVSVGNATYSADHLNAFTFEKAYRMFKTRQAYLWEALSGVRLSIESEIRQTSMTVRGSRSITVEIPLVLPGFPDYDPEETSDQIAAWLIEEGGMEVTKLTPTRLLIDWSNAPADSHFLAGRSNLASGTADKALNLAFERIYTEVSMELRKACTLGIFECWAELPITMTGYALYKLPEATRWVMRRANDNGFKLQELQDRPGWLYWSLHRQLGLPIPKKLAKPPTDMALGDIAHNALANPTLLMSNTPFVRATSNIIASYAQTKSIRPL
jgi:hypothetical protein